MLLLVKIIEGNFDFKLHSQFELFFLKHFFLTNLVGKMFTLLFLEKYPLLKF